jgi:hypothetical protein
LIYSRTSEEHEEHLQKILKKLRSEKLYAKLEKCEFRLDSVSFLRHVIFGEGVAVDPEKVKAVVEWTRPTSVFEIQSFLGLAGYYRHFIKGFSKLSRPFTALTRKNARFVWTDECQQCLQELKRRLITAPVLALPTKFGNFVVYSDASERTNQILEDMLRACVLEFKGSWVQYLPLIEFAYNNNYQATIGMPPYEALYG